jgi:hypothetical protein
VVAPQPNAGAPDSGLAARPAPVVLDDLAAPRFASDAREVLDALGAYGADLVLEPDGLCEAARARTGLDTWGASDFRDRLGVLCDALGSTNPSAHGRGITYEQIVGMLGNRLLLEDLIARHPEIEAVPIDEPIVVAGLPRTGTTHLHNLLSADPSLRHLPYWESLEPVPPLAEQAAIEAGEVAPGGRPGRADGLAPDPRLERCEAGLGLLDLAMPHFVRMHEMTVDHAHEEIQLLALDVAGMLFETTDLLPAWRDLHRATDQTPSYAYLRRVLQALTWLRPGPGGVEGTRWVLKSPQHLEQLGPLLATFPDATVVLTHRDPVAVTTSMTTMVTYSARMRSDHPDVPGIARYWADRIALLLDAVTADRDLVPDAQSIDVRFDDFMADEAGVVQRIYDLAGQPFDAAAERGMAAFLADHPRGRHGTVVYDLEALGLQADAIVDRNRTYAQHFAV